MSGMSFGEWSRRLAVALLVVMGLVGCASVERDETTGQFVDDAAITAKVKTRLAQEPGVSAFAISVETQLGVVLLSGFVADEDQRERAIAAVRGIGGVRSVNGAALVVRPERRSN